MQKTFKAVIIVNYKTGDVSIKKRKPKTVFPVEIPINFELTVNLPEPKEFEAKGEITLSEAKAISMVVNEI